jgi:beta-glucosidase
MKQNKISDPITKCLLIFFFILCFGHNSWSQVVKNALYLDDNQPLEERVNDLISRLTIKEKAILLDHTGPVVSRFNIRADGWNQAMHGVWWDRPTTLFPVPTAMAATWDTKLVREVATAISDEARGIYNGWHEDPNFDGDHKGLIYRAPILNIGRNPYWGRNYEIWGEDPFLTGKMGVAFVKGMQGDDPKYLKLAATLKHYAVNNVEKDRHLLSANVSERMLHEYWLPAFKDAIIEGQAQSVMASYNAINGVPNVMNEYLLTEILKKDWGFEGFVVSDLGGVGDLMEDWGHYNYSVKGTFSPVEAVANALNAGTDFSDKEYMNLIPAAVEKGLVSEDRLNDALYRVLRDRFRLGEFDPQEKVPYRTISPKVIGSPEHRQLALKIAQKSIVLLTNNNKILPIDKDMIQTIAVLGPLADKFIAGGYSGVATDPVTPLQGIKNRIGTSKKIIYAQGVPINGQSRNRDWDTPFYEDEELEKAVSAAKEADVAIVFVGTTLAHEREGFDRTSLGLPGNQETLINKVLAANPKTIVVEINAGPLTIPEIKNSAPGIIEAWWNGEEGGNALADVIFGDINPGGKLPYTVYASESQVPPQDEYDITKGFTYMYLNGKPLFPFGHGLSYTNFEYSKLKIAKKRINDSGDLQVSVQIKNTGKVTGDEVAQLYVHDVESSVRRPSMELRGFERINLEPGQSKTVDFIVPGGKLSFYDEKTHAFKVEPGLFDLYIGSSSEDIRLKGQFEIIKN